MRFIKRIQPTNIKPEFLNDDLIEFDLPNNVVDMSSFKIFYDAYVDPVYKNTLVNPDTYLKRFMPRLSQSIIQELNVSVNNNPIQQIKDFNLLFNILNDGKHEDDEIHSERTNTMTYSYIDDDNLVQVNHDLVSTTLLADYKGTEPLVYKYFINKFLGFINDVKFLDCRDKNIKISIRLAPKWITYRGFDNPDAQFKAKLDANGDVVLDAEGNEIMEPWQEVRNTLFGDNHKYRLRNVHANINIVSPDEDVPFEKNIRFEDFKNIKGVKGSDKNTYLSIKHKGNINYILSTFTDENRETDAELQLYGCNANFGKLLPESATIDDLNDGLYSALMMSPEFVKVLRMENVLNNSIYFKRNGLNIKSCQYRLNGQDITPIMNMMEIYNLAREFFGGMKRVHSTVSFQNEFFCMPISVGKIEDGMLSEIEWIVNADSKSANGGEPIMFVCYDKTYKI